MDLQEFVEDTLYPALFDRADDVFLSMEFKKHKGGWASPFKMNGERSKDKRKDKTVITRRYPQIVLEQGGDAKNIISFYQEQNGLGSRMEAIKSLCERLCLFMPIQPENESYMMWRKKQERLELAVMKMRNNLYSEEGKKVLEYLRNVRGYDDEFIEWSEMGYCSYQTALELMDVFTYKNREDQEVYAMSRTVGRDQVLAIPYRTGSKIQGFIFRAVEEGVTPKYKDAFISATASKRYHLFGLSGLPLTGDGEKDRDMTVVEGEIDALRALYAGVPNVVAASGGEISSDALLEAKRKGVRRVTIMFDTEGDDGAQEKNYKKAIKAITTIHSVGLKSFVRYLPSEDGGKVDVDSYLKNHSGEELQAEIEMAMTGAMFLYDRAVRNAAKVQRYDDNNTYKEIDDFKREVIEICNNSLVTSPTDRDLIFRKVAEATQGVVTKEGLQEEADREKEMSAANRQRQEIISLTSEAYEKAKRGKIDEALSILRSEKVEEISDIRRETEMCRLLELPTEQKIRDGLKSRPTGVKTGYFFGEGDKMEQFVLPCGALTYICAPTSHGKSRMLENLALQLARNGDRGDVLYFSFEEDMDAVTMELLNIYVGENLSANNLRSLNSYYKKGESYFRGNGESVLRRKEKDFFGLLTSGRLRVFYEDFYSDDLIAAIKYMSRNTTVKAVFIDYIQLLHKKDTRLQRKDELKEICSDLMKIAVETRLPVVLAAQMNREAYSPVEMTVQNIAEASDIEHSANMVVLLWNSVVNPLQRSNYKTTSNGQTKFSMDAQKLEGRGGFYIGQPGHIYAVLAKNRGGARNLDAVLNFNGNTGVIDQDKQGDNVNVKGQITY